MQLIYQTKINSYFVNILSNEDFVYWGSDISLGYKVIITKDQSKFEKFFLVPFASAFDESNKTPTEKLITNCIEEIIKDDLLNSPNHKEFVYSNSEFTGVVDNTI